LWAWSFNEGQGDVVKDTRGKPGGRVLGEYRWLGGNALELNGISGHVQLQDEGYFQVAATEGLTLEARVRVVKSGTTQLLVFASPTLELEVRSEGTVSFNLAGGNGKSGRCLGVTSIADGLWHDIAAVRDAKTKTVALYIDGYLDAQAEDGTAGSVLAIPRGAYLGGKPNDLEMFGGAIDKLQLTRGAKKIRPRKAKDVEVDAPTWTLANEHVEMLFTAHGSVLGLTQLTDRATGTQFIETEGGMPVNLWQVGLRSARWSAILDASQGVFAVEQTEDRITFSWTDLPLGEDHAVVTMSVELPAGSAQAQWKLDVSHDSKDYGVWNAECPRIPNLRKLADDPTQNFVALSGGNGGGAGEGQLHPDPWNTMHPVVRTYPCYYQSMQFNAWYGPDAGLYLATHDGDMHLKGFFINPTTTRTGKQVMSYTLIHYPADSGVEGTEFHQPYPAVIGVFHGDWYDAARLYRGWALDQVWCRLGPSHQRTDISPWIKNSAWWTLMPVDREPNDRPAMRKLARTLPIEEVQKRGNRIDIESSVAKVERAYEYFGFPMVLWSNEWWEGGGDYSPPRYTPLINLVPFLEELHARVPDAYFSGHTQPKRYSVQVAEYDEEVEWSLEHTAEGHDAIEAPNPAETYDVHAYPCWATKFWQDFWYDKSASSAALGLDGFHIDELGSQTNFAHQCFNREHGHPIGGGTLYADTRRNMLANIRKAARTQRPQFAAHHEVLCEIYIDLADAGEVCTTPSNANIPMWEAVYHDYHLLMGRRIIEWLDRNTFPLGDRDGDELIDEFVSSYGQTYIWGNQPSWTRIDILDYAPRVAAVIKRTMESRYRAIDYLNFGDMMRPLVVTEPLEEVMRIWRLCDTPENILPVVMNSVWKAPDGTEGIVLFNITDQPQKISYRCDLSECGLQGDRFKLTRIDGPQPVAMGHAEKSVLERTDEVEPYNVVIIKVESAAE